MRNLKKAVCCKKITKNNLKTAYLLSFSKSIINRVGLTDLKKKHVYAENPSISEASHMVCTIKQAKHLTPYRFVCILTKECHH